MVVSEKQRIEVCEIVMKNTLITNLQANLRINIVGAYVFDGTVTSEKRLGML